MSLIDKLRKAREQQIEVNGRTFTIRRPTDMEAARLTHDGGDLFGFVIGWDLREVDLIPGGDPVPAAFSTELFREWVSDQPDLWKGLTEAIQKAYADHVARRETQGKP